MSVEFGIECLVEGLGVVLFIAAGGPCRRHVVSVVPAGQYRSGGRRPALQNLMFREKKPLNLGGLVIMLLIRGPMWPSLQNLPDALCMIGFVAQRGVRHISCGLQTA